jgi:prepilin-type N-terminal cleavage/methylation domain-containing protein
MKGIEMKRNAGFSLIELLVAMAITVIIILVSLDALTQAEHAAEGVTLMSNMTENLRAGMNYISRDLVLAGTGVPTGGISIPNGSGVPINRPGPVGMPAFPLTYTAIPAVTPGAALGPNVLGPTDIVTIMYADNLAFPPLNVPLSGNAINDPAPPPTTPPTTPCNGAISITGAFVTFDAACVNIALGNGGIAPGDLIMFSNAQGNTIETVTSVAGQTVNFATGAADPYNLNGRTASDANGTILELQAPVGTYPPTTATRIWMVTYYLDTTLPNLPRLMRRVNFRPAGPVAETIEQFQISYNFVTAGAVPCGAPCSNQKIPPAGLTANQMESANLFLAARSDQPFSWTKLYFRDNLVTQVSLRGLAFFNNYQ